MLVPLLEPLPLPVSWMRSLMSFAKPWRHVTARVISVLSVHSKLEQGFCHCKILTSISICQDSVKKPFPELFDAKKIRAGFLSNGKVNKSRQLDLCFDNIRNTGLLRAEPLPPRLFLFLPFSPATQKTHLFSRTSNSKSKPNNQTKHCMCLACLRFGLVWWAFENVGTTAIKSLILAWRVWSSTRGPHRVHLSCRAIVSLSFWIDNVTVTAHRLLFLPYHPIWKCRKQWMGFQLKNDCINSNMSQKGFPNQQRQKIHVYMHVYIFIYRVFVVFGISRKDRTTPGWSTLQLMA